MIIDERTYTLPGQHVFARLSGDYNPMHLDTITARRELFGAVVVHGMNAVLTAVNAYLLLAHTESDAPIRFTGLRAKFIAPIYLDSRVITRVSGTTDDSVKLVAKWKDNEYWKSTPCCDRAKQIPV